MEDIIYGRYQFSPTIERILQHHSFKRLEGIAQLGFSIYSSHLIDKGLLLKHTRAEHCKGVAYLASVVASILQVSDEMNQLLQIAGLLHDVGHGAFSHAFEKITTIHHEQRSQQITRLILQQLQTLSPLQIEIVCYFIDPAGIAPTAEADSLKDIISNKHCYLDVDKIDYLLRDSYYAKQPFCTLVEIYSLFNNSGIVDGVWTFNQKDQKVVAKLFQQRQHLFTTIYFDHDNLVLDQRLVSVAKKIDIDWDDIDTFLSYDDTSFLALLSEYSDNNDFLRRSINDKTFITTSFNDIQSPQHVLSKIPYF